MNALHLAVTGNHVEVVRMLLEEFGMSVTRRDIVSCMPLLYVHSELCALTYMGCILYND